MNRAEVTDINFVTPDSPNVRANRTFVTFAPFAGAIMVLGFVATQHMQLTNKITSLKGEIQHENRIASPASDTLLQYRESIQELEALNASLTAYDEALPVPTNWPAVIAHVSSKLPGVDTNAPQVTLNSLRLNANAGTTPMDYGAHAPNRDVLAEAVLNGTATDKNAVANAIIEFETDPDLLYSFPGTSINSDVYDFRITIGVLGPERRPEEPETPTTGGAQ